MDNVTHMPSGAAFAGPNAVMTNVFMRLGAEWDGFSVHPKTYYGVMGVK